MTSAVRRRREESFAIHEDVPSTEDTEMNDDAAQQTEGYSGEQEGNEEELEEEEAEEEDGEGEEEEDYSESDDEDAAVDLTVQEDMEKLQDTFPGFRQKYRLVKRIGEGWSWLLSLHPLSPSCPLCPRAPPRSLVFWTTKWQQK